MRQRKVLAYFPVTDAYTKPLAYIAQQKMERSKRIIIIRNKLKELKRLDRKKTVFGSQSHNYISKPINSDEIKNYENQYNVLIPDELKLFLIEIGYGAGPDYGIYNIQKMFSEFDEWNDWMENISSIQNSFELKSKDSLELINSKTDNPDGFFYKRLKTVNGLLPIQTQGCTYYSFIVINGEQKGKIWNLDTNEFDVLPGGVFREVTFFEWYENWLNDKLESLGCKKLNDQNYWERAVSESKMNWLKKILNK